MLFPKPQRVKDRALLDSYHTRRCIICNRHGCDPCHIKSKGSGGTDEDFNLLPMCRLHHTESHSLGWDKFLVKYPVAERHLESKGWSIDERSGIKKLVRV